MTFTSGLLLSGCAELSSPTSVSEAFVASSQKEARGPVLLQPGDVIRISFPGAAELNHSQRIRKDGRVALPLVGEMSASGKTVDQLRADLAERYKPQLQNTEVFVTVETSGSPVIVSGSVGAPGKIVLDRPTTALEAIMQAGGFSEMANQSKVRLIRIENGIYRTQMLNLRGAMRGDASRAVYLRGGDMLYVPERLW